MLNRIIDTLEADERLSGWQVREIDKRSHQLFLNMEREESVRVVDSLIYEVEILVNRQIGTGDKKRRVTGNSRFTLDPSSLQGLPTELELALESAALVDNEAYSMAEVRSQAPQVALSDLKLEKDPQGALRESAQRLRQAASKELSVRLSAAEFFADRSRTRYFNSQGIHILQESTLFSGEYVLLAKAGNVESEVFRNFKHRRVQDLDIETRIAEAADLGRKRSVAVLPKTGSFDVVFSAEALDHFFSWFSAQASAASKYNRMTRFEIGEPLLKTEPGASPLTLWHNALVPYGVGSYRVDANGSVGCRRLLIENGKLKCRWATSRYAQYLKQEATGDLGNLEIEAGKYSQAELFKVEGGRPLYHLHDFSYFEPNPITGEFSAEIRAGEEITPEGRKPIKGGSVSGLSSAAVASALFSVEREQRERYLGPKAIRCSNLTLAGS